MDQNHAGTGKTIFVVDGNSERRERTEKILVDSGYAVMSASSAEEAEAIADTSIHFDLIVTAVVMDGENGIHLAEHIEKSQRTNSTLLISHFSRDLLQHVPGFIRQPNFLANPFSEQELLSRVRALFRRG